MNRYVKLKNRQQAEVNALPIKAAFGNSQFKEMMSEWGLTPDDTDKILKLGGGCFIKKEDRELVCNTFARHRQELKDAINADPTGEGFIYDMFLYELNNHEYGYTGDSEDTLNALGITYEDLEHSKKLKRGFDKAVNAIIGEEE